MAGGRGSRLKMGEKPLVTLFGRPLIDYVALALEDSSVDRIFVATTENVPHTRKWATREGALRGGDRRLWLCGGHD